jgi:hydrophobic/amphiphilic exporter-1 (mainly G- bacteria), HAE1 family
MDFKNISSWSIKHPVPTILLFLLLTLAGLAAFPKLGIDESPNIDIPIVSVAVTQMGAAPSELETEVTRKIEDSIAGLQNIKHITSTVNEGSSSTTVEFELGTNIDRAVNDVRNAISKIRTQLPQSVEEPVVQRVDFAGGAFVTYTIASERRTVGELSWMVDNDISKALLAVQGVGQVQRSGGVDREIRVNLDPGRLEAMGVTADVISAQLRQLNINMPGGRGELGSQEQSIRTLGSATTPAELAHVQINLQNGAYARLDSLGTVTDATSEQRQLALLNGKPVVAFSIVRSTGSNIVDVEERVDHEIERLGKRLPEDVSIQKIRTNAFFVEQSYEAAMEHLIAGALLACAVIWLFLRDWRAALISGLAMPLSLVPTFFVMQWAGYTLNNMTLLALALVIGILVDDAIVEIENIVRHMSMGKKPYTAALEAADEIGLAVVATTMAIVVVFVPVAFMGGIPGQFFKQFGLTVAAAVLFSLLVARMLTPLIAAHWLKPMDEEKHEGVLGNTFEKILKWALLHRGKTVIAALTFFIVSLGLFSTMPTSLVPSVDRGESLVSIELPPGSTLADTRSAVDQATALFSKRPEVTKVFATIGTPSQGGRSGGGTAGGVNKATVYVSLKPRAERKLSQQQFEAEIRPSLALIPGARTSFTTAGGLSGKLKILLTSDNQVELDRTANGLVDEMRTTPGLADVVSSASLRRPEIIVRPDFARAAEQGISVFSIARTASVATLGDTESSLPKFSLSNRQINIRVQIDPRYRGDLETIRNLRVQGTGGRLVPLDSVATVDFGSGPSQVDRYDRSRQVTIEASLNPGVSLGDALKKVHQLPAFKTKSEDVREIKAGDAEIQRDVFSGFAMAMGAAVVLIYAVMTLLFGGFLHPLTIMMAMPLSLGGAVLGLILNHQPLGLYGLIGIVMLMGIVTKNSILLVEYCLVAQHSGKTQREAILESARARMRPILMTTIAMIAGMAPIAVGFGAGSEVRAPMAIAVIGGLITSTLLTLVVVPVVYSYIDDFQKRFFGPTDRPEYEVEIVQNVR